MSLPAFSPFWGGGGGSRGGGDGGSLGLCGFSRKEEEDGEALSRFPFLSEWAEDGGIFAGKKDSPRKSLERDSSQKSSQVGESFSSLLSEYRAQYLRFVVSQLRRAASTFFSKEEGGETKTHLRPLQVRPSLLS